VSSQYAFRLTIDAYRQTCQGRNTHQAECTQAWPMLCPAGTPSDKLVKQRNRQVTAADSRTTRRHISDVVHMSLLLTRCALVPECSWPPCSRNSPDVPYRPCHFLHSVHFVSPLDRSNLTKDAFRNWGVKCLEN
jgi:hypothetical protein